MEQRARQIDTGALFFSQRLWSLLAAALERPLAVVDAPMGYGKTVAVREFLRREGLSAIWVPVLGGGPESFWRDFCRELGKVVPDRALIESLRTLGYPHDWVRADAARELIQDMRCIADSALVVDDFHLLPVGDRTAAGMGGLAELLAKRGGGPRVVLVSRDAYPGSAELLKLKGVLAEIRRDAFALSAGEIVEYFAACGLDLPLADALRLHLATEGWISALYLHLLNYSTEGRLSPPASLEALLDQEVYSPLSRETRELLFSVHPLDRFSERQAAFLHGGDVRPLLSNLGRRNSFLFYDVADDTYTLHSLVRGHVGRRFDALPAARRRAVYSRLADWHIQEGETVAAIDACREADDIDRALGVFESDMNRNLVTENAHHFLEFFKSCPREALARHIPAAFKFAFAALSAGDVVAFGEQLAWLGERAAALPDGDAKADALRGEIELLRSLAAYNDIAAMSVHHRRANELLKRPTRLFGPESPWTLGSPSVLFMFHRESGKLAEEIRLMHECMPHYYRLASGHGSGGELLMEAEALYEAGDFARAAVTCHRAGGVALEKNQLGNVLAATFLRVRLALVEGRYDAASAMIQDMRDRIRERRDYFFLHTIDMVEGYLQTALGRAGAVPAWLGAKANGEKRLYAFAGGSFHLVHGRYLLIENRNAEVLGLFAWLLESGVFARHLMFTIYARLYRAVALGRLGRRTEAAAELAEALRLALPDAVLMPFAENWGLIGAVAEDLPGDIDLSPIVLLAQAWEKKRLGILARHFPDEAPGLTERELEMAALAVSGKKYREIAEAMFLAPTTVKKAFVHIYRKLGISSREELRDYMGRRKG